MRECDPKDAQLALIRYAYEHHDVSRALLASPSVRIVQRVRELLRKLNEQEWERHSPGSAEAAMAFLSTHPPAPSLSCHAGSRPAAPCRPRPSTTSCGAWRSMEPVALTRASSSAAHAVQPNIYNG